MIIDCIGCLHGFFPMLEGGDLLIITGDLTARNIEKQWHEFGMWMDNQKYEKIVFIAGNHDMMIERWDKEQDESGYIGPVSDPNDRIEYLYDSGTEFEGLKIWGSPWTKKFEHQNPKAMAFCLDTEEELASKFSLIPDDTDIVITHSPSFGELDGIENEYDGTMYHAGSHSLLKRINEIKPKIHVFSHIHEQGSKQVTSILFSGEVIAQINCSYVNEKYEPRNKPIRVIL